MEKPNVKYIFLGIVIGLFVGTSIVVILIMTGSIAVFNNIPGLANALQWTYKNLRLSIIPFAITLIWFFINLKKLGAALDEPEPSPDNINHLNNMLNIIISLFFGIGVIWTAIGMRAALIAALGDMDASTAAAKGAWAILKRLVDGGILIALSTTIVGGVGGYLMRLYKALKVGHKFNKLIRESNDHAEKILKVLEEIRASLEKVRTSEKAQPEINF